VAGRHGLLKIGDDDVVPFCSGPVDAQGLVLDKSVFWTLLSSSQKPTLLGNNVLAKLSIDLECALWYEGFERMERLNRIK
jgi:hypothetical protein